MSKTANPSESDYMVGSKNERLILPRSAANLQLEKNESIWIKALAFVGLSLTTAASSSLLYAARVHWVLPDNLHEQVVVNRASAQLVIQVLAGVLGIIQIIAVCQLIHFAARLHMMKNKVSLQWIQFYNALSTKSISWSVGFWRIFILTVFLSLAAVPAALWVGSLTPVSTSTTTQAVIQVPQYKDMSNIHYYASEATGTVPVVRTWQGTFTYGIAMQYLGQLVLAAAKATTRNGSQRRHSQYNNAQLTYIGRSYGVGASVGLMDHSVLSNRLLQSYSFMEVGYHTTVHCSRNNTSNFRLANKNSSMLFSAQGLLPNSPPNKPEHSTYFGQDMTSIVAIGVARNPVDQSRWLAIAAGENYAALNSTQCRVDFVPTLFKVTVGQSGQNITVTRKGNTTDPDPSGDLTQFVTYSLQQISTDSTNLYSSSIGNAFNSSIIDYKTASTHLNRSSSDEKSTMTGLSNSIQAMLDDVLVIAGSAQMMITKDQRDAATEVKLSAFRLGKNVYIYIIFGFNSIVLIAVMVEAIRTWFWKDLSQFSFQTPSHLIVATAAHYGVCPDETEQEDGHRCRRLRSDVPEAKRVLAALNVGLSSSGEAGVELSLNDDRKA